MKHLEDGGRSLRILVAGESWLTMSTHAKGVDQFAVAEYTVGADEWLAALGRAGTVDYLPGHRVPLEFPTDLERLAVYDAVFLSDIGANSLLLHPDTWLRGQRTPNRLRLLHDYVAQGGGLGMIGGYLSFQGFEGKAGYHDTWVEKALPVDLLPYDDRLETPEGSDPVVVLPEHAIVRGLGDWPYLLGMNRLTPKAGASTLVRAGDQPLLVVRDGAVDERGRSLAWASDIGPHWCPRPFMEWEGYELVWERAARWLGGLDL